MKGTILDYSIQENAGIISAEDGTRYNFKGAEWKESEAPTKGMKVDFDIEEGGAVGIFSDQDSVQVSGEKNKLVAGLLAIFLGGFGIHKFYLGYTGPALVFLLTNTIGWIITMWLLGLPNLILGIIAFVEGILYLTMSDEDFEKAHVQGRKPWF